MSGVRLSDSTWRSYEHELAGQFMSPEFDAANPPSVTTLLERDNVPPQPFDAIRKVDRFAPADAAAFTIGSTLFSGSGSEARFVSVERRSPPRNHTVFDGIGIDVRRAWIESSDNLREDNESRLKAYLRIFQERTLTPPLPKGRFVTAHHIETGGQLSTEIGGFLRILSQAAGNEPDNIRHPRYHELAPIELARAAVHMATLDSSTPRWMTINRVRLHQSGNGAATLRTVDGNRLWRGGDRPKGDDSPLLKCPVKSHGFLKDIVHAAINEAIDRGAL